MKPEIILKGGRVIDPAQGLNKITDVAIADGKILSVGEAEDTGSAEIIEVSNFIVIPGLVDTHVNAYGSLGFSHPDTIGIGQGATSYVEAAISVSYSPQYGVSLNYLDNRYRQNYRRSYDNNRSYGLRCD